MAKKFSKSKDASDEIMPCYLSVSVVPVKMGTGKKNPKPLASKMIILGGIRPSEARCYLDDFLAG